MHSVGTRLGLCCQLSCTQPPSGKVGIDLQIHFQSNCRPCFLLFGHQHPTHAIRIQFVCPSQQNPGQPSRQLQHPAIQTPMKTRPVKRPSCSHKQIKRRLEQPAALLPRHTDKATTPGCREHPAHKGPLVCRVFATPWSGSFVSMTGEQRSWLFKPTLDLLVGARWTLHGTSLHGSLDCGVLELARWLARVLLGWADELDTDGMSWMLVPEKQKTGPTIGLEVDLEIDPDFARGRLSTRQLTTEAETRPDTVH